MAVRAARISRRGLLVGGGAGIGLIVAWAVWPRRYEVALAAGEGEAVLGHYLKIAEDGRVTVAVPQAELGQGSWTALAQIAAEALGADWESVGVEPAPVGPAYANLLLAAEWRAALMPGWAAATDAGTAEFARRNMLMLTGGSSSVRAFEAPLREAGTTARALLLAAAAERWNVDRESLVASGGAVRGQGRSLGFGALAARAADLDPPSQLPAVKTGPAGPALPRLDTPGKAAGAALFAGDVRLPDMVFASVRAGPLADRTRLVRLEREAADRIPGVLAVFETDAWVGAAATNWWAADRAVEALQPTFASAGRLDDALIEGRLTEALEEGEGAAIASRGQPETAFRSGRLLRAHYACAAAPSAAPEPLTATARIDGDRLELWCAAQAPQHARAAAARAAGMPVHRVVLYPTIGGGGYGRRFEVTAIEQVATMAAKLGRPVQLTWSRFEESVQDGWRPPARAALTARVEGGRVLAWRARIAVPPVLKPLFARVAGEPVDIAPAPEAVAGATPPYEIPDLLVEHVPAALPLRAGYHRGGAHGVTAFFTESFVDELARRAGVEPLAFRMRMLGDNPRLARVLARAAAIGGWDGGAPGSAMGIAAHSAWGSHVATLCEVAVEGGRRVRVLRAAVAVDCGRVINPGLVRQQIEGGVTHAIGTATGAPIVFADGRPDRTRLGSFGLPRLADSPAITVEIVPSDAPPGGVTELGVPTVAPAIANALFAATGQRLRALPLIPGRIS